MRKKGTGDSVQTPCWNAASGFSCYLQHGLLALPDSLECADLSEKLPLLFLLWPLVGAGEARRAERGGALMLWDLLSGESWLRGSRGGEEEEDDDERRTEDLETLRDPARTRGEAREVEEVILGEVLGEESDPRRGE